MLWRLGCPDCTLTLALSRCEFPYIVSNLPLTVSKTGSKNGEQQDFSAHTSFCAARHSQFWTRLRQLRACKVVIQEVKQFHRPAVRLQAFDGENKLLLPD